MCIVLFDVFNGWSSSIKEINRLTFFNHLKISKTKPIRSCGEGTLTWNELIWSSISGKAQIMRFLFLAANCAHFFY